MYRHTIVIPKITLGKLQGVKRDLELMGRFFTAPVIETEEQAINYAVRSVNESLPSNQCVIGAESVEYLEDREAWEIELKILA